MTTTSISNHATCCLYTHACVNYATRSLCMHTCVSMLWCTYQGTDWTQQRKGASYVANNDVNAVKIHHILVQFLFPPIVPEQCT